MANLLRPAGRMAALMLISAGLLTLSGCHKRPEAPQAAAVPAPPPPPPPPKPEPFTGTLTEIDGVQAVISFRHPKLVDQDLEKLMTAIPEAAVLRPMLEQLAPFGYPEFSEIAADSNIGLAILNLSHGASAQKPVYIYFAKLKEGGKIATLLSQQNMVLEKRGEWTLIARDSSDIAKLPSIAGVAAFLEKPQTEDIRAWTNAIPVLADAIKGKFDSGFMADTAGMPEDKRNAVIAYADAAVALLSQLHSVSSSLSLGATGIKFTESYQFKPDSPVGIFLRYKPGPAPAVAGMIAADGVATLVYRQQPKAAIDLIDSIFDTLIAVNYPSGAARLKSFKAMEDAYMSTVEGGAGVLDLDAVQKDGQERLKPRFFYATQSQIGAADARAYFQKMQSLSNFPARLARLPGLGGNLGLGIENHTKFTPNALTVDGVAFDSMIASTTVNGQEISGITEYLGDSGGKLVVAVGQATLEQRLPALLAGKPLPNGIPPFDRAEQCFRADLNGARLVDALAQAAKLDQTDPDVRGEIGKLKAEYNVGEPPSATVDCAQARADIALNVPYPFISATIHLTAYLSAQKFDLRQLFMPAIPPQHRHQHVMPAPEQRPDVPAPSN